MGAAFNTSQWRIDVAKEAPGTGKSVLVTQPPLPDEDLQKPNAADESRLAFKKPLTV